jgi:xanthine dehydrogenase small subunit
MGTVGGNIANGSPIGDLPPALIALGSTLVLQKGEHRRLLPLEDFFLAYGRQDREPGEFVYSVRVPRLRYGEHFRCYKVSKRIDQDISAVMGAFKIAVDGARIGAARVAFGGMAGIPQRAPATEAALVGARLDRPDTWHSALAALPGDFSPIDDHRASAQYRTDVARALLRRALAEMAGASTAETRVAGRREDAHVGTR